LLGRTPGDGEQVFFFFRGKYERIGAIFSFSQILEERDSIERLLLSRSNWTIAEEPFSFNPACGFKGKLVHCTLSPLFFPRPLDEILLSVVVFFFQVTLTNSPSPVQRDDGRPPLLRLVKLHVLPL